MVTLAVNLPGPLAAARLASLGADVTKVEPPHGDPLATASPSWYKQLTADQRVIVLDLKSSSERAALDAELVQADLLVTAMRPSALRRLRLDRDLPTQLSHIEIVGHDGALEEQPGHDLTYQATCGTLQPPRMPTAPIVDMLGAERAVSAALASLLETARTGVGRRHRVALEDAAKFAGAAVRHGLMGGPHTMLGGGLPTYGIYAAADGFVALGAIEPHFRDRLLDVLGVGDTHADIAHALAGRTTAEWVALAQQADIPLAPVTASSSC
jgi:crotonobetainyl-CoA:carnitine CoA-transferase CaiB-like acyl-CoA transferase